jgi:hypothetical protein
MEIFKNIRRVECGMIRLLLGFIGLKKGDSSSVLALGDDKHLGKERAFDPLDESSGATSF